MNRMVCALRFTVLSLSIVGSFTGAHAADERGDSASPSKARGARFSLQSATFAAGKEVPDIMSCFVGDTPLPGSGSSPELGWSNAPRQAGGLAIVARTSDTSINWLALINRRGSYANGIPSQLPRGKLNGITQYPNSFGITGYSGICPSRGERQTVVFELFALRTTRRIALNRNPVKARAQLKRLALSRTSISGTYVGRLPETAPPPVPTQTPLPTPTIIPTPSPTPFVETPFKAQSVTVGGYHSCALTDQGGVKCWGDNSFQQLGTATFIDRPQPGDVDGLTAGVASIGAGLAHTCVLTEEKRVKCWGNNTWGQLGDGTAQSRATPTTVAGLTDDVIALSVGLYHACALEKSGKLKCWGDNEFGQIGDGSQAIRLSAVTVEGVRSDIVEISAGGFHTCVRYLDGTLSCWGDNENGQLGIPGIGTAYLTPVAIPSHPDGTTKISAGGAHSCALVGNGTPLCWGFNGSGRLGDGTTIQRSTPDVVVGLESDVVDIIAGAIASCAISANGGVKCWGRNDYSQLGIGSNISALTPTEVVGLESGVRQIAPGLYHSCAVKSSGQVYCWGDNSLGQLGNNAGSSSTTPVVIPSTK